MDRAASRPRTELAVRRFLAGFVGPHEMGRHWGFWLGFLAVIAAGAAAPDYLSRYDLLNLSNFLTSVFLALGLALMWGFCGILSLGQGAFLGLGGYAYGIAGINFAESHGHTWAALGIGLAVPVAAAAVLGFIMFYARLRGVYVAILMLVVTLLLETFLNQTAGRDWFIGDAHLGGNNGLGRFSGVIREPPPLSFGLGEPDIAFTGRTRAFYFLTFGLLVVTYLSLRLLVNSRAGRVMIAIREDAARTEALGYDIRAIQVGVFCLGAFLAGLSGVLYVSWESFITPAVFGVQNNILPVIWVAVAGRKSLTAAVLGALLLLWLSQELAVQGNYALVVQGGILILVMMLMPEGVVTGIAERLRAFSERKAAGGA